MKGFTLFEMLVVLIMSSILMSIAVVNFKEFNTRSVTAASQIRSLLKDVRAKAISQTRAYKVTPVSDSKIEVYHASKCTDPFSSFEGDPRLYLSFPRGTKLLSPSWSVCFNSRGIADSNIHIYVQSNDGILKHIEVLLGGATKLW